MTFSEADLAPLPPMQAEVEFECKELKRVSLAGARVDRDRTPSANSKIWYYALPDGSTLKCLREKCSDRTCVHVSKRGARCPNLTTKWLSDRVQVLPKKAKRKWVVEDSCERCRVSFHFARPLSRPASAAPPAAHGAMDRRRDGRGDDAPYACFPETSAEG